MSCMFGCVNNGDDLDRRLGRVAEPGLGTLTWNRFDIGWFAAGDHSRRTTTWTDPDGNAWVVLGEHSLMEAARAGQVSEDLRLTSSGDLLLSEKVKGTVAVFQPARRRLLLACDCLNCFPLYYRRDGRRLVFGSHLPSITRVTGGQPDPTGVVEFLRENWCLDGRTVVRGVRRLLPGQLLQFDAEDGTMEVRETSRLWTGVPEDYEPATDEEVWHLLLDVLQATAAQSTRAGLMLSGGWDSRVLLAALAKVSGPDRVVTLTHGAAGHREPELARRLAARLGVRHISVVFGPDSVGRPHDLDAVFDSTDSLLFPWWRFAGPSLKEAGCDVALTGLLGEVLGGHYTVVGRGRLLRAHEVFQRAVLKTGRHSLSPEDGLRKVLASDYRPRTIPFLKKEVADVFEREAAVAIPEDVARVVERYQRRGIGNAGRMVEAYNTEYRALDHFCQQPVMLNRYLDISVPLGSLRLVDAVLRVPLARRIHNSLSRRLLAAYQPDLLSLPLAATMFVPANAPIILQEVGRVVRRVTDRLSTEAYSRSRGRVGMMRRFGWIDFEDDVRTGDYLDAWRGSLRWEALDRAAIDRYVSGLRDYRAHVRLARPLLKLAYFDRLFGRGSN